jgi:hypothetical protein
MEFRIPSNLATAFCIMHLGVKTKNFGILDGHLKGQSGKKITYGGPTTYIGVFDFLYEIKSKELEKKCHETVFIMEEDKRIKLCGIS